MTHNLLDDRDTLCLVLLTEQLNVTQLAKVESCSVSRPWSVTSNSVILRNMGRKWGAVSWSYMVKLLGHSIVATLEYILCMHKVSLFYPSPYLLI